MKFIIVLKKIDWCYFLYFSSSVIYIHTVHFVLHSRPHGFLNTKYVIPVVNVQQNRMSMYLCLFLQMKIFQFENLQEKLKIVETFIK